jgi:hypothetical protein
LRFLSIKREHTYPAPSSECPRTSHHSTERAPILSHLRRSPIQPWSFATRPYVAPFQGPHGGTLLSGSPAHADLSRAPRRPESPPASPARSSRSDSAHSEPGAPESSRAPTQEMSPGLPSPTPKDLEPASPDSWEPQDLMSEWDAEWEAERNGNYNGGLVDCGGCLVLGYSEPPSPTSPAPSEPESPRHRPTSARSESEPSQAPSVKRRGPYSEDDSPGPYASPSGPRSPGYYPPSEPESPGYRASPGLTEGTRSNPPTPGSPRFYPLFPDHTEEARSNPPSPKRLGLYSEDESPGPDRSPSKLRSPGYYRPSEPESPGYHPSSPGPTEEARSLSPGPDRSPSEPRSPGYHRPSEPESPGYLSSSPTPTEEAESSPLTTRSPSPEQPEPPGNRLNNPTRSLLDVFARRLTEAQGGLAEALAFSDDDEQPRHDAEI